MANNADCEKELVAPLVVVFACAADDVIDDDDVVEFSVVDFSVATELVVPFE